MRIPDPRYVTTPDGTCLAYLVMGEGPVDIAWPFDFFGHLDCVWESPMDRAWFEGLASFGRLILHDRRGTGLSSRQTDAPNLETQAADLRVVLDAAGSQSTVIGSWFGGLAPGVLLAATDPDRVRGLVWWGPSPRTTWAPDYPWGWGPAEIEEELRGLQLWGTLEYGQAWADQSARDGGVRPTDEEIRAVARQSRNTCSPDVVLAFTKVWWETDLRAVLPSVRIPTLLFTDSSSAVDVAKAEYVAALMPTAELVVFPAETWPTSQTMSAYIQPRLERVRRFVTGTHATRGLDRVLATVLFTDIVGSTEMTARLGDQAWKATLASHDERARAEIERHRGTYVHTTGDGLLATFDGPARAVRCAQAISQAVSELGLEIRAGCHTGEVERVGADVQGITVHLGARVAAAAGPGEVLVTSIVKDLVAGSNLVFEDAGEHDLKGAPDRWHLYSVTN